MPIFIIQPKTLPDALQPSATLRPPTQAAKLHLDQQSLHSQTLLPSKLQPIIHLLLPNKRPAKLHFKPNPRTTITNKKPANPPSQQPTKFNRPFHPTARELPQHTAPVHPIKPPPRKLNKLFIIPLAKRNSPRNQTLPSPNFITHTQFTVSQSTANSSNTQKHLHPAIFQHPTPLASNPYQFQPDSQSHSKPSAKNFKTHTPFTHKSKRRKLKLISNQTNLTLPRRDQTPSQLTHKGSSLWTRDLQKSLH